MNILNKETILELVSLGVLKVKDENGNDTRIHAVDTVKNIDISNDKAVISTCNEYAGDEYVGKEKQFIVQLNNISNDDITSLVSIKTLGFISNINKMIRLLYIIGIVNVVGIVLWILLSIIGASSSPRY